MSHLSNLASIKICKNLMQVFTITAKEVCPNAGSAPSNGNGNNNGNRGVAPGEIGLVVIFVYVDQICDIVIFMLNFEQDLSIGNCHLHCCGYSGDEIPFQSHRK